MSMPLVMCLFEKVTLLSYFSAPAWSLPPYKY